MRSLAALGMTEEEALGMTEEEALVGSQRKKRSG
jgi:hypothetical protein